MPDQTILGHGVWIETDRQSRIFGDDIGLPTQGLFKRPIQVLIVASRLKDYVRAKAGFNTSERVLDPLSDIVRRVCDEAIENARRDDRRTVLDRDIPSRR